MMYLDIVVASLPSSFTALSPIAILTSVLNWPLTRSLKRDSAFTVLKFLQCVSCNLKIHFLIQKYSQGAVQRILLKKPTRPPRYRSRKLGSLVSTNNLAVKQASSYACKAKANILPPLSSHLSIVTLKFAAPVTLDSLSPRHIAYLEA